MTLTRREFLKGLGFAAGGAGLTATSYRHLIPFIHQPDDIIPGVSTWYASACRECPAGCSMIVRNRDGHAVKCEGNPLSPLNKGALCARGQAVLHGLYDPDRVKGPMRRTESGKFESVTWDDTLNAIGAQIRQKPRVALVTDLQTGSLHELMHAWMVVLGSNRLITYEPINYEAIRITSGGVIPSYNIKDCEYLISFSADFLETWISPVEYTEQFSEMREMKNGRRGKFSYVGPRVSMTAANADHRLLVPSGASESIARAISYQAGYPIEGVAQRYGLNPKELSKVADDISSMKSILALPGLSVDSARAASIINSRFSSQLVDTGRPHALSNTSSKADMAALIAEMESGGIDILITNDANPIYSLPSSSGFVEALSKVPMRISLSSYMDETSAKADWILPSSTPLESWGDYAPYPGMTNLHQPTMGLLFDTRETGDILLSLAEHAGIDISGMFGASIFHEYLRKRWTAHSSNWEESVKQGGIWDAPVYSFKDRTKPITQVPTNPHQAEPDADEIRLWAFPHIYNYDGRGANRRWLQEIPEPVTNAVWSTWAEIHTSTAARLGIRTDDVIEISLDGKALSIPAYVWDGAAPNTIAVPMGGGHTSFGRFAEGFGVNVSAFTGKECPVVTIKPTGKKQRVTRVKGSSDQQGREIAQTVSVKGAGDRSKITMPLPAGYGAGDFYPPHEHKKHRWVMTVDMNKCIGCHACVAACYAENNIGVVGTEEITRGREMSWIRIDRYIDWNDRSSPILFQPMMCQQCDAAPCEPVCPVYASAHSDEGLNMQIYNRCIGTRYCSHNCPYKVRRFNWYDYKWPAPMQYQLNPDVTVRCRGVMEKCTFCIQRIREVEIKAVKEERPVADGEIIPACVQTCPTGAFTFGDLMDPNSRVSEIIANDPRAYQVLAELNTKPAVIYLKKVVDEI
ncbi:MAG: 4Fe-4S dicluster domain-containing protein [Armatimonadota bacterium]